MGLSQGSINLAAPVSSSGLEPALSVVQGSKCSLTGLVLTLTAAGMCVVEVDQSGDANYLPAPTLYASTQIFAPPQMVDAPQFASPQGAPLIVGNWAALEPVQSHPPIPALGNWTGRGGPAVTFTICGVPQTTTYMEYFGWPRTPTILISQQGCQVFANITATDPWGQSTTVTLGPLIVADNFRWLGNNGAANGQANVGDTVSSPGGVWSGYNPISVSQKVVRCTSQNYDSSCVVVAPGLANSWVGSYTVSAEDAGGYLVFVSVATDGYLTKEGVVRFFSISP